MCKNSSRRTPRPKNLIFILCFNKKGRKTKKGDENSKNTYKSLSLFSTFRRMYHQLYNNFEKNQETRRRRTKKHTPPQKSQKMSLRPYDKTKKCSDCHPESSHTCKNSSRRTPRFKNLNFLFFVQIAVFPF